MTKVEATALLRARSEDAKWDDDEVSAVFAALFEREPDDDDGDVGDQLSQCYAAAATEVHSPSMLAVRLAPITDDDEARWAQAGVVVQHVDTLDPEHADIAADVRGQGYDLVASRTADDIDMEAWAEGDPAVAEYWPLPAEGL